MSVCVCVCVCLPVPGGEVREQAEGDAQYLQVLQSPYLCKWGAKINISTLQVQFDASVVSYRWESP